MGMQILQGSECVVRVALPIDFSALSAGSLDFFQEGERIFSFPLADLTVSDGAVSVTLSPEETMTFSPHRVAVCFHGAFTGGGTVDMTDVPVTIQRSQYKAVADQDES